MKVIPVDQLQAGMVVDADVCDRSGRMLLGQGSQITDRHLRIFKAWGITEAKIRLSESKSPTVSEPAATTSTKPAENNEKFRQYVESMFRHTNLEHPFMQRLFNITIERLEKKGTLPHGR